MTETIKYNTTGKIVSGKSLGWFLRVEETEKGSGSYLILVSKNHDFLTSGEGYDYWAENQDEVQGFFDEIGWSVLWFD